MMRLDAIAGRWAAPVTAVVLLYYQKSPLTYAWRPLEMALLLGLLGLSCRVPGATLKARGRGVFTLALGLILVAALLQEARFDRRFTRLARAPAEQRQRLGRHFIVGFSSWSRVERLSASGAIGGIYLARHNVAGHSVAGVRRRIDRLQSRRRSVGLPLLLVATDQEGGAVSRLSPPLPRQDALAALLPLTAFSGTDDWPVADWAGFQARGLAAMGVNLNFSPVVDLKPRSRPRRDHGHTQIYRRAIAADPALVTRIGLGVCQALEREGVLATVKHFPGLGGVSEETHLTTGRLDLSPEILAQTDWVPFREITRRTRALMMLGHVRLPQVDPDLPASFSRKIIQGIIRGQWRHDGLLITDDLNMGPAYGHPGGIGAAAVKALNAGVDLLLIAYDPDQYYRAMSAVLQADDDGHLDRGMLRQSATRLAAAGDWLVRPSRPPAGAAATANGMLAADDSGFTSVSKMVE